MPVKRQRSILEFMQPNQSMMHKDSDPRNSSATFETRIRRKYSQNIHQNNKHIRIDKREMTSTKATPSDGEGPDSVIESVESVAASSESSMTEIESDDGVQVEHLHTCHWRSGMIVRECSPWPCNVCHKDLYFKCKGCTENYDCWPHTGKYLLAWINTMTDPER